MTMQAKKIIIDTDLSMGEFAKDVDDGLAIAMALNSPELDVVGISGVYGNTKLRKVSKNVPVLLNMFPELKNPPKYIQGTSSYRDWKNKVKLPGIDQLEKMVEEYSPISIIAIGPLTNIALLYYHFPEIMDSHLVEQLVIMGGALDKWEFNFANDPAAAEYVLNLPIQKVICGYEVCMAQKFTRSHYDLLLRRNTNRSSYFAREIKSWLKLNELFLKGKTKGFYPFDCVAIAYVIHPEWFESMKIPVNVTNITKSRPRKLDFTTKSLINQEIWAKKDTLAESQKHKWVDWMIKIKSEKFMEFLMERLY